MVLLMLLSDRLRWWEMTLWKTLLGWIMEKPGEQCTIVFKLSVTEPDSDFVCVGGVWGRLSPPPPASFSVTIHAKTTVNCSPDSSMGCIL